MYIEKDLNVKDILSFQECVPENLELKTKVFSQIDNLVGDDTIVASSSSCLVASSFTEKCNHRNNMLVAHPVLILSNCKYFLHE
jgi:L-gulonate 3-dehydrogenase